MIKEKINTVIVDDEAHAIETLKWELERACPEIRIVGEFQEPSKAVQEIPEIQPELLFLDVEMPKLNGFDLLEKLEHLNFGVVFTTAYDQFALKAIKHSAIDYILKPIERTELREAVDKFIESHRKRISTDQLNLLFNRLAKGTSNAGKIALPSSDGLLFKSPADILRCESDSNYTVVHFTDESKHVISKTLKEIAELLEGSGFIRVHNSHLVNLEHITKFSKKDGGYVELDDGSHISVSRNRKEALIRMFS